MANRGALTPGNDNSNNPQDSAEGAQKQYVQHGPCRRKTSGDVCAEDAVESAIGGSKEEQRVARILVRRRIDASFLQERVRADGKNGTDQRSRENS